MLFLYKMVWHSVKFPCFLLLSQYTGAAKKDVEDGCDGSEGEDVEGEEEGDESDLDLAWKMLDVARAIVEKQPEDTLQKVEILEALGEVSLERGGSHPFCIDY